MLPEGFFFSSSQLRWHPELGQGLPSSVFQVPPGRQQIRLGLHWDARNEVVDPGVQGQRHVAEGEVVETATHHTGRNAYIERKPPGNDVKDGEIW